LSRSSIKRCLLTYMALGWAGIDTAHDLSQLPPGYRGGILTNEIETVAAKVKGTRP
jgi:hypothetical protein